MAWLPADPLYRAVVVVVVVLWVWMIWACWRHDPERSLWLWIVLLFPIVGGAIYFLARWLPLNGVRLPAFAKRWTHSQELLRAEKAMRHIGNPHQFVAYGDLLRKTGQPERAADAYRQALGRDPKNAPALWNAAQLEMDKGELETARDHLQSLMEIDPDYRFGDAALAYGRTLLDLGETALAREHIEADLKRRGDPHARILLARVLLEEGHTEEARARLEEMLEDVSGARDESNRRARDEIRRLLRRTGSAAAPSRMGLAGAAVAQKLARHPFLIFLVVAACAVAGASFLPTGPTKQAGALSALEEELAAQVGFDPEVLLLVKQYTGGREIERLVGRQRDSGDEILADGIAVEVPAADAEWLLLGLRGELGKKGYLVFWSRLGVETQRIGVMRGYDQYAILRLKQTNGSNYAVGPEDVVAKLKAWEKRFPFEIVGADFDWVSLRFLRQPEDLAAFAREVQQFCPDAVTQGAGTVDALAREIRDKGGVFLRWD